MKKKRKLFKYIGISMICIAIIITGIIVILEKNNYMNNVIPTTSMKINKESVYLSKGDNVTLKVTITPSNATHKKITWKSSNTKVVTVSKDGKLTWVGPGTATITAKTKDRKVACVVTALEYIITDDSKLAKYPIITGYNSSTLKYRVIRRSSNENNRYSLIWVKDANKQFNSAMPKLGEAYKPEDILSKEIKKNGYEKKGLIATNASPFWDGWGDTPCIPFIINKGKIVRDIKNVVYKNKIYVTIGIKEDGTLKNYSFNKNNYKNNQKTKQRMLNDGVRNTFASFAKIVDTDGKITSNSGTNSFTVICQVDRNNFVLYTGSTISLNQVAKDMRDIFKCQVAYNMDGGASQSLFYKKSGMSKAKAITTGREVPDMIYFVEQ